MGSFQVFQWQKPEGALYVRPGYLTTQPTKLLACWVFNAKQGPTLQDVVGTYHGTIDAHADLSWGETLTPMRWGLHSRQRSGGTRVQFATIPSLTSFTLEAWIVPKAATDGYGSLLSQGPSQGFFMTAGALNFYQGTDHLSLATAPANRLVQLVGSTEGTAAVNFYQNGVFSVRRAFVPAATTFNSMSNDTSSETLGAGLVLVRLWAGDMPLTQVAELYQRPWEMFVTPEALLLAHRPAPRLWVPKILTGGFVHP